MKITDLTLRTVDMTMKFPFETSVGVTDTREILLIEVTDGEHIGYGECVADIDPYYSEETVETALHIIKDFIIPRLKDASIQHPSDITSLLAPIRRHQMAKGGVECALWDLYAKQQGKSLSEVLGGTKTEVPVGISIGIQKDVETLIEKINAYVNEGYQKIKIKIKPGFDYEILKQVRETFPAVSIMADANSAFTLQDIELFKKMDTLDLLMIEQPLAHDDIVDHSKLQAAIQTPVCLDESIHSFEDARKAIELGSCKTINIKIGRVGGLFEAKRIHDLCAENNIPVWCGGMFETGIGRAHNVAISSLHNFSIPGDTAPSARYWDKDIIEPEITMNEAGYVAVPTKQGIGVKVDQAHVDSITKRLETFSM
ncbi:O-succinylbenzoate synthase [Bacillaceae bacterium JMAK1]|nr:O-succinylbenzoate synthase [Bacillaceae bacterium JMAK1]